MDLVSIIVPVYNIYHYLPKCVDSILSQTYSNIEVILVDDGSKDLSGKLCDKYSKESNVVKAIHQENSGLSKARNVGLRASKGDFVVFVDGDDYIRPDMIESMMDSQKSNNADVVICNIICKYPEFEKKNNALKHSYFGWRSSEFWHYYFSTEYSFVFTTAWNKLYKKSVINSLSFPIGKLNEDEYFVNLLFFSDLKINYMKNSYYIYVQRNGSITHSEKNVNNYDGVYAILERAELFSQRGQNCFAKLSLNQAVGLISKKLRSNSLLKNKKYYAALKKINVEILKQPNVKLLSKILLIDLTPELYVKLIGIFKKK